MKTARNIMRKLACTFIFIAIAAIFFGTMARQAKAEEDDQLFSKEELVQMLAPIALYPDSLIAQMLMASTYPLEVVEAERWRRDNMELQGDALFDALRDKPWDPSVKSLCNFPDVLFAMSDKLDQTRRLGDAFLVQEQEVMDTIQELRQKARDQGNLKNTREQKVIVERETIRIEPAYPTFVYVPVYDPYYVYGPWWYPAYLPYYWYYPYVPFTAGIYISFGPRIYIGGGLFSWVWFDWYVHRIYINFPRTYRFHRYQVRPNYDRYYWRHDPGHRRGVTYRDRKTSERFGAPAPRLQSPRPETRSFQMDSGEKKAPAPSTTAPVPSRERTIAPEKQQELKKTQPEPLRKTTPPAPAPRRERAITPEKQQEPRKIQPEPLRETPAPGRERPIAPEKQQELRKIQPAPSRETPVPGREQTITPETRREQQKVQPPPAMATPPPPPAPGRERRPAPTEKIEPEKIPSFSGQEPPSRGGKDGGVEQRPGERGEKSRRSGETQKQKDIEEPQEDTPRRRDDGPRR